MFQLQTVKIYKHPIFGNAKLNFGLDNDSPLHYRDGNMTSVIIGRNGIGKSYLLKAIADIFRSLDILINGEDDSSLPDLPYRFEVQYSINDHVYNISDMPRDIEVVGRKAHKNYYYSKDGQSVKRNEIRLPNAVIASSMTIADKFPTPSSGIYKYRGVRNEKSPSTTGTRTIVRKAVEGIFDSLAHKHTTLDEIRMILRELGLQPQLKIRYRFRYKDIFIRYDMSPQLLHDIYTNWQQHFKTRKGEVWGAKHYHKLSTDYEKVELICSFLRRCAQESMNLRGNVLTYDVFSQNNNLMSDCEAIKMLSSLDILTFPEFIVFKSETQEGYEFANSSSGETQQLCQFVSIMSAIESNSLVLIDEPENSSHPNWQMKYIGWLQKIFSTYKDCHFIVATHSHFLLTDLKPEWSNIIALDKTINGLINMAEGMNTFCWSTDDILYRVFHVRNTRNYSFEHDLYELYDKISKREQDISSVRELVDRLDKFVLGPSDPLKSIIESGKAYVEHN